MQTNENQKNKQLVMEFWQSLEGPNRPDLAKLASTYMSASTLWYGPDPINQLHGSESVGFTIWM